MTKRRIVLRFLVSPFILGILIVSYAYGCLKRFVIYLRYGGEWITYHEKDSYKTIDSIYYDILSKDCKHLNADLHGKIWKCSRCHVEIK